MSASNQTETIDAYLRGELSPAELRDFESQLKTDPNLAKELAFQKQVISGIQQVRKLQLKNRLAQVDVGGGVVTGQATWVKFLGGVLIATVLGIATWQLLSVEESDQVAREIDAPIIEIREIPTIEVPQSPVVETIEVVVPEPVPAEENTTIMPVVITTEKVVIEDKRSEVSGTFTPQVALPEDESDLDSSEFEPEELGENFSKAQVTGDIDALNIERLDEKARALRYRYYDGKLALYGDFGDSPYQILEINQQDGVKQIFLLHAEKYYRLEASKQEVALIEIKDPALLSELAIFQNRK